MLGMCRGAPGLLRSPGPLSLLPPDAWGEPQQGMLSPKTCQKGFLQARGLSLSLGAPHGPPGCLLPDPGFRESHTGTVWAMPAAAPCSPRGLWVLPQFAQCAGRAAFIPLLLFPQLQTRRGVSLPPLRKRPDMLITGSPASTLG